MAPLLCCTTSVWIEPAARAGINRRAGHATAIRVEPAALAGSEAFQRTGRAAAVRVEPAALRAPEALEKGPGAVEEVETYQRRSSSRFLGFCGGGPGRGEGGGEQEREGLAAERRVSHRWLQGERSAAAPMATGAALGKKVYRGTIP